MSFTRQRSRRSRLIGLILPVGRPPSLALALLAASLAGVKVRRTAKGGIFFGDFWLLFPYAKVNVLVKLVARKRGAGEAGRWV
jgi:hypothetical protein